MTILLLLLTFAYAQEKSAFEQSLVHDTGVHSEESWVEVKNKRFRKIDLEGRLYYLRFKDETAKSADIFCAPPPGAKDEMLIIEQPREETRSREFVQALQKVCVGAKAGAALTIPMNAEIGLTYPAPRPYEHGQ